MNPHEPDRIWEHLRLEARAIADREPVMEALVEDRILVRSDFWDALAAVLSRRLAEEATTAQTLHDLFAPILRERSISKASRRDLSAVVERDPAANRTLLVPFLHFKGFQSLQAYRIAHRLWTSGRRDLALYLQGRIATVYGVDFHPAAVIGEGILIDHATGVVVGETAVVGNDVSMLHGVTLGGTGKDTGDRHPKVGNGVLLGAGAKVLGNIRIGQGSKIGAGSVVLSDVPEHVTVVGVPARIVGRPQVDQPALDMDQTVESSTPEHYTYEI
ncbi:MAG TPA: serine O-acetyltransferase [Fibrobacteria bacterium]|nr:serine O-acetyltransferase [Fibrobacteria bacterium]